MSETQTQPYRINILDPDLLQSHVEQLAMTIQDMKDTNPNIRPIKWQTKDRWLGELEYIYNYFSKFVRKDDVKTSEEGE